MPDPIAFMVMPFDRRSTDRGEVGVPTEVDFDLLWFRVYQPVLTELGYRPIRADADVGSLIITEMIHRLVLGDLVVADLTMQNANVYYEVGVRHAARRVGCLLTAADWAKPAFDLAQMRQVRFPLADGLVGQPAATTARAALIDGLRPMLDAVSPVFAGVPGYPAELDVEHVSAFAALAEELLEFDADVRTAYLSPRSEQRARVQEVLAKHGHKPAVRQADAMLLLRLLRDLVDWRAVLDYIATLPKSLAQHPLIMEQECLAMAKGGSPGAAVKAAARLEAMMRMHGETSERLGLLGGRYKQLARQAGSWTEQRQYLDKAISSYERGMMVDLNDYYPTSNLPRLYRARKNKGDDALAAEAEIVTMAACRRALARGIADEWVRPTLLGLAFDRADASAALALLSDVIADGPAAWKVKTTHKDLLASVNAQADDAVRQQLSNVLIALEGLLADASPAMTE